MTYVRDEGIPFFFAEQILQVVKEREALLVGNAGERVVRVFAFEVDDQLGEFVVWAELGDRV